MKKPKSKVKPEMQALEVIQMTRQYLDYLERHIKNIEKAWLEIQEKCNIPVVWDDYKFWTLHGDIENHDLSKFGAVEFTAHRQAFYPTPTEAKRDAKEAFNHHITNNPHHWENWVTQYESNRISAYEAEMHCTHMVVDWLAMSYEFGDTPRSYYENNKDKIKLPEWAVEYIYEIFDELEIQ